MRLNQTCKAWVVALACIGLLSGQAVQAAGPLATAVQDVELQPGGVLHGQLVNAQAIAQSHTKIAVVRQGEVQTVVQTDADGRFAVDGLNAGIYELQAAQAGGAYRCWTANTAPPVASDSVLLVQGEEVVLGQGLGDHNHNYLAWLANPWVLAAIVAGAIAIPLAIDDDDAS